MRVSVCLILFLILANAYVLAAQDENSKLSHINAQIQDVKKKLKQHKIHQSTVQQELQKNATAMTALKNKLNTTTKKMQSQKQNLLALNDKHAGLENQISQEKQLLVEQIQACYKSELQKNAIKNLLEIKGSTQADRILRYFKFLNQQRLETLTRLNQKLALLNQNQKTIESETQKLNKLKLQQQKTQQQLLKQKLSKALILKSINEQLVDNTQKLSLLISNKKQLEKKIQELSKVKISRNYLSDHTGKFPWPLHGKVVEYFGTPIAHSQLKQTGILISASAEQSVNAVAPGKVIFANTMSGYGKLIIIAHGKGYMTLYGNNAVLYKKVNDNVKAGDLIAQMGNNPSGRDNVLYFGLRKNGKAIDPCQWCGKS